MIMQPLPFTRFYTILESLCTAENKYVKQHNGLSYPHQQVIGQNN